MLRRGLPGWTGQSLKQEGELWVIEAFVEIDTSKLRSAFSHVKPYRPEGIRIFVVGASEGAIKVAGKHADTFALWGSLPESP